MADAMVDAWGLGRWTAAAGFIGFAHRFSGLHDSDSVASVHRQTTVRLRRTIVRWSEFAHFPICKWYAHSVLRTSACRRACGHSIRRTSACRRTCGYW